MAEEYRKMLGQRVRLGIPSKVDTDQIRAGMPVVCLIALAHFRKESSVKDRLVDGSTKIKWPLYLCEFAGSDARVPRSSHWEPLGMGSGERPPRSGIGF